MSKVTNSNTPADDRIRLVSSFSADHLELARDVPITMALTVAINGLRVMFRRHAGGPYRPEDVAILEVTALLCMRLLSAKGAPRMQPGLEGVEASNLAVRS